MNHVVNIPVHFWLDSEAYFQGRSLISVRTSISVRHILPPFFMDFTVNYLAILAAAVAAFFIGFMWHGPVFGKQWMKLMKITPAQMKKGQQKMAGKMHWYFLGAFAQQLVVAFALSLFANMAGVVDAMGAVVLAFWVWLVIAATLLNGVLWEERSIPLYLFNITYQFVNILVITLIVGLWL